jgi:hypothetical protein
LVDSFPPEIMRAEAAQTGISILTSRPGTRASIPEIPSFLQAIFPLKQT